MGASLLGLHINRPNQPGEEYYLDRHPLTITAVLRGEARDGWRLELHSPISHRSLTVAGRELPLSSNIPASIESAVRQLETQVNPWTAFFNPEIAVNHQGLLFFQPYQPQKIPIVLVHGLLSNPAAWGAMINDLLNTPELMEKYQIWAYLYPTSEPFLETASEFRKDLQNTRAYLDPAGQDPALQNMILVGHSMGGLLSRLQVTWSGHFLWNEFSRVPFSQIRGNAELRQKLAEMYFFGPKPFVKRVVFMAVPHRGSILSSRVIGCLGRLLAGRLPALESMWIELRRLNPEVFPLCTPLRLPSSIDQLAPNSPAIRGLAKMPFAPWVHLHSIIGTGGHCRPCFPGDGVVSVQSRPARRRGQRAIRRCRALGGQGGSLRHPRSRTHPLGPLGRVSTAAPARSRPHSRSRPNALKPLQNREGEAPAEPVVLRSQNLLKSPCFLWIYTCSPRLYLACYKVIPPINSPDFVSSFPHPRSQFCE